MIWRDLSTAQREALVRDMARQKLTDGQIETALQAPEGAIRTVARRLGVVLLREKDRKTAQAAPHPIASANCNMWVADEARRRELVARRAARGASEALRAFR